MGDLFYWIGKACREFCTILKFVTIDVIVKGFFFLVTGFVTLISGGWIALLVKKIFGG